MTSFKTHEGSSSTPHYQIVSFGDSQSDVGTYALVAADFGGGRFTTNPGEVWPQIIARSYGDTLSAAYTGGFGTPMVANPSGFGYAQGGARISTLGSTAMYSASYDPDSSSSLLQEISNTHLIWKSLDKEQQARVCLSGVSITDQIASYLQTHKHFTPSQLVLLNGGNNDVLSNTLITLRGQTPFSEAVESTKNAASQYAELVEKLHKCGAQNLIVINMIDLGKTPVGNLNPKISQLLTQFSVLFNTTLTQHLAKHLITDHHFVLVDAFNLFNNILENYQAHGFYVGNTEIACKVELLPTFYQSALFCSPALYKEPHADQTYMFADSMHPSTRLHALLAAHAREKFEASLMQRARGTESTALAE